MARIAPTLAVAVLALCAGCGTAFDRPRPAAVEQLDITRKEEYILGTKATLKNFRTAARDLRSRRRPSSLRELAVRFESYVALQVEPILDDFEAQNNLGTRMELGKLRLLCALTHLELAERDKARALLEKMEEKYGDHPELLEAPLDRGDIGVTSLEGGLKILRAKIAGKRSPPHTAAQAPPTEPAKRDPVEKNLPDTRRRE